jgi:hypothetical protein
MLRSSAWACRDWGLHQLQKCRDEPGLGLDEVGVHPGLVDGDRAILAVCVLAGEQVTNPGLGRSLFLTGITQLLSRLVSWAYSA